MAGKHAVFVTHKIKGKIESWVTNDFLQAMIERNYIMKKANQSKSIIDWNHKRNQVSNMKNTLKDSVLSRHSQHNTNNKHFIFSQIMINATNVVKNDPLEFIFFFIDSCIIKEQSGLHYVLRK